MIDHTVLVFPNPAAAVSFKRQTPTLLATPSAVLAGVESRRRFGPKLEVFLSVLHKNLGQVQYIYLDIYIFFRLRKQRPT